MMDRKRIYRPIAIPSLLPPPLLKHRSLILEPKMPPALIFALATIPAVLGLQLPGGVGKLPALGWNSWVWPVTNSMLYMVY
jgi:hypothetical protein